MTVAGLGDGTRRVVEGFGRAVASAARFTAPRTEAELRAVFEEASEARLPVALRGAGRSYGDAILNEAGVVVDLSAFNTIIDWNPKTGVMELEGGATIEAMWRTALPAGAPP
jgi:FAD/FMN-containing dehydrogenase